MTAAGATIVNATRPDSVAPPRWNAYTRTAVHVAHSAKLNVANATTTRRIAELRRAARSSFIGGRAGHLGGAATSADRGGGVAVRADRRSTAGAPRRPARGGPRALRTSPWRARAPRGCPRPG